jgi:xanthine dehydrogenase accessory factor
MIEYFEKMNGLLAGNVPFVAVTIVDAVGSVPQEIGAKMLVVEDGLYFGTIGGGKVETRAIQEGQKLLGELNTGEQTRNNKGKVERTRFAQWSLEKDIGMTCGGSVKVYFETYNTRAWHITVFGAGHCATALIELLVKLDCRITCVDPRPAWLDRVPDSSKLTKVLAADMPAHVKSIPDGSFVLMMTMGHTTDKPILLEILRNWKVRTFPYLGVIGSKAKAVRLRKDIAEAGLPAEYGSLFFCPVGLQFGDNQPYEIAISIAGQLLQMRDQTIPAASQSSDFGCEEPALCEQPVT